LNGHVHEYFREVFLSYIALIQATDTPLTLMKVIKDIPHDAAAIFVYIFTAFSLYLIWRGSRGGNVVRDEPPTVDEPTV
jgi:hypothetical protein